MLSILVNTDAVQVTLQFICLFDKAFQGCVTVLSLPWFRILPGQYKTCPFFFCFFLLVSLCALFFACFLGGMPENSQCCRTRHGTEKCSYNYFSSGTSFWKQKKEENLLCVEVVQFDGFMTKYPRNGPANMEQQQYQRLLHFTIAENQANGPPAADSRSNLRGLCLNSLPLPLRPRVRDFMPTP